MGKNGVDDSFDRFRITVAGSFNSQTKPKTLQGKRHIFRFYLYHLMCDLGQINELPVPSSFVVQMGRIISAKSSCCENK